MTNTEQGTELDWALVRDYLLQLLDDRDEKLHREAKYNGYCQAPGDEHECGYDDSCEEAARERELIGAIMKSLRYPGPGVDPRERLAAQRTQSSHAHDL